MKRLFMLIVILPAVIIGLGCGGESPGVQPGLTVAAPNYLKGILDRATAQFEEENRIPVKILFTVHDSVIGYAGRGSHLDAFLAADPKQFRALENDTTVAGGKFVCPFRMSLVLAGRAGGPRAEDLKDLRGEEFRRVVIVDPDVGYEGRLAAEVLKKRRLWDRLQPKLIRARSIEQLLSYLKTGEADAAILFESSLHEHRGATVMQRLDTLLDDRLLVCGAVTASSKQRSSAQAFLDLLSLRLCPLYDIRGIYRMGN